MTALIPAGLNATLVLVRHGEFDLHRRGPVPGPGGDRAQRRPAVAQARLVAARLARPGDPPALADPGAGTGRDRPLPACPHGGHRGSDRGGDGCTGRRSASPVPARPEPGIARDRPGRVGRPPPDGDRGPLGRRPRDVAATAARGLGTRRRAAARASRRGSGRRLAGILSGSLPRPAGCRDIARRPPGRRLPDRPGRWAVDGRRRSRRHLQGPAADAVRPAARAVLDVVVRPRRDLRDRDPRRPAARPGHEPRRASRPGPRRGGPGRDRRAPRRRARSRDPRFG